MEVFNFGGIMSKCIPRCHILGLVILPVLLSLPYSALGQVATKPLRASEVMALQAGGALQANLAHDIAMQCDASVLVGIFEPARLD